MRRLFIICLLALSATALLVSAPAASAAKAKKKPAITRVTPMRISVGNVLTIRGRNFKPKRKANTVIFRSASGRTAFAKPRRASRKKLVVVVPAAVARLLDVAGGRQRPTRIKLRVLAGTFSRYTTRRLSPVVTAFGEGDGRPGGGGSNGGGGGTVKVCNDGGPNGDHDGDLLLNKDEPGLGLDPCLADTDGDSVEDGYEFQSAVDLNHYPQTLPLPYPGKRPYPNPLDPGDGQPAGTDYDGDGLKLREEFLLWLNFSSDGALRGGHPTTLSGLLYSDGLQKSVVGLTAPSDPLYNWALDMDGNNQLSDDERDADADGLGNWDELRGRMTEDWWPKQHDGNNEPKESKYPDLDFLDNEDTDPAFNAHVDGDMDGDGVLDGADDNDHDGLSNQFEVRRPDDWLFDSMVSVDTDGDGVGDTFFTGGPNPWAYTNPFNPCKPFNSERCHSHPPFGYYDSDEVPPIGPNPPAGYPGGAPTTPDG